MMRQWHITSTSGACYGVWRGDTRTQALLAMHRDAGLSALVVEYDAHADALVWHDKEQRQLAGDVDDWLIREGK